MATCRVVCGSQVHNIVLALGFSPTSCSCPRPVVTRARVCTWGKSKAKVKVGGGIMTGRNSEDSPEPRRRGKLESGCSRSNPA